MSMLPSGYLTTLSAGQYAAAGVYYSFITTSSTPPPSGNSSLIFIVGTGADGVVGQQYFSNDPSSTATIVGSQSSGLPKSILRGIETMAPEGQAFVFVRVTDGTELSATMSQLDNSNSPSANLSFIAQRPGTNANLGYGRADIVSGDLTASPVARLTLSYPGGAEIFDNIVAYATPGGAFDLPTYTANAVAAVNGGAKPSVNWVAAPGASQATPAFGIVFSATGGTDGADNVTDQMLLGAETAYGATGVAAGSGSGYAACVPQLSNASSVAAALSAVYTERPGILLFYSLPQGTLPNQAPNLKVAGGLSDDALVLCTNWDQTVDGVSGTLFMEPALKIAAGIMSLAPYQSPLNKPSTFGAQGISAKEFPNIGASDAANLRSAGIMYYTRNLPGSGNTLRLAHQHASSGTNIQDTRMKFYLGAQIGGLFGELLGELQATDSTDDTEVTGVRYRAQQKLDALGTNLVPPPGSSLPRQLNAYQGVCNLSINPASSVIQGQLQAQIFAQTLSGVEIILVAMAVGNNVQVTAITPATTAA